MHRVKLEATNGDHGDNYVFDLTLNDDNKPVYRHPCFGVWGYITDDNERFPFILTGDGMLDFGCQTDEGEWDRYHQTNIFEKFIRIGEYITIYRDNFSKEVIFMVKENPVKI